MHPPSQRTSGQRYPLVFDDARAGIKSLKVLFDKRTRCRLSERKSRLN